MSCFGLCGPKKFKVYVTRRIPSTGPEYLRAHNCDLTFWDSDEAIPHDFLVQNVAKKKYDALLCLLTDKIDADVINAAGKQLKIVASMSVGFEHIDRDLCKERNILVTNTPGVSTDSVAEFALSLAIMCGRRMKEGVAMVKEGKTDDADTLMGTSIMDKVVGIYGLGRIGYGVAKRFHAFKPSKLLYHDVVELPYAGEIDAKFYASFLTMAEEVDYLILCCNLTKENTGILNMENMSRMKKTAIIINIGRGGVINHEDLATALSTGVIGAAGIDVTVPEPLPPDHPLVTLPNCVVSPHMGSNTWDARKKMSLMAASAVVAALKGETPETLVK